MAQRELEDLEDSMLMSQAPALASIQTSMSAAASTLQLRPVMATAVPEAAAALLAPKSPPGFVNPSKYDLGGSILSLSANSTILSSNALKQFQLAFIKCQSEFASKWVKGDAREGVEGGVKMNECKAAEDSLAAEEEKVMKAEADALLVPSLASVKKRKADNLKELKKEENAAAMQEAQPENDMDGEEEEEEEDLEYVDELGEAEASALTRMFTRSNAKRRRVRKDANGRAFIELSMPAVPPLHVLAEMNAQTSEEVAAYAFARNLVDFGENFLREEKEFKDAHKKGKTVAPKKVAKLSSASSSLASVASLESDLESLPLSEELPALSVFSDVSTPGSDSDEHEADSVDDEHSSDGEEDGSSSTYSEEADSPAFFDPALADLNAAFPLSPSSADQLSAFDVPSLSSTSGMLMDEFSLADFTLPSYPQASPKASPRPSPFSLTALSSAPYFHPLSSPSAAFGLSRAPSTGMAIALESVH